MLSHSPFIVLLEEHCADQADDSGTVREDADDVGAPADFFVQSLLRVVGPDLATSAPRISLVRPIAAGRIVPSRRSQMP